MKISLLVSCSVATLLTCTTLSGAAQFGTVVGQTNSNGAQLSDGDTLLNSGTLQHPGVVVWGGGPGTVPSFVNTATGVIRGLGTSGHSSGGVGLGLGVTLFENYGLIEAPSLNTPSQGGHGVFIGGTVGTFSNFGTITGLGGQLIYGAPFNEQNFGNGVGFGSLVSAFSNTGAITGGWNGVYFEGGVGTFTNGTGGVITSTEKTAVGGQGNVTSFRNDGIIRHLGGTTGFNAGVDWNNGNFGTFTNTGLIESLGPDGYGVALRFFAAGVPSFTNSGTIRGTRTGVLIEGQNTVNFTNSGTVAGTANQSAGVVMHNGTLTNTGTISGVDAGVLSIANVPGIGLTVINSGTISGGQYAIAFPYTEGFAEEIRADTLQLLNGSRINGLVEFGLGTDLLDVSAYAGTMVLQTANLENVKLADGSTRDFSTFASQQVGDSFYSRSGDTLAVLEVSDITGGSGGGGVATAASNITTEVSNIVASQLSDIGGSSGAIETPEVNQASAFAPERPLTDAESAVLSALDVTEDRTHKVWANVFGGGSYDTTGTPSSSVFGGIVAGSHAQVGDDATVGALAGYVRSSLDGATQDVGTSTAIGGLYGQTSAGSIVVDGSIIVGYNFHQSVRDTGGAGMASASFNSWFLTPDVGLTVPVLEGEGSGIEVMARAKYVTGSVGGFTETGTIANLTVGDQAISLLDGRIELKGHSEFGSNDHGVITVSAKVGLFAQSNLGGSSIPVTVLGNTFSAVTPGTVNYGLYSGVALKIPLGETLDLDTSLNSSARTDGVVSASGKVQVTASF